MSHTANNLGLNSVIWICGCWKCMCVCARACLFKLADSKDTFLQKILHIKPSSVQV